MLLDWEELFSSKHLPIKANQFLSCHIYAWLPIFLCYIYLRNSVLRFLENPVGRLENFFWERWPGQQQHGGWEEKGRRQPFSKNFNSLFNPHCVPSQFLWQWSFFLWFLQKLSLNKYGKPFKFNLKSPSLEEQMWKGYLYICFYFWRVVGVDVQRAV